MSRASFVARAASASWKGSSAAWLAPSRTVKVAAVRRWSASLTMLRNGAMPVTVATMRWCVAVGWRLQAALDPIAEVDGVTDVERSAGVTRPPGRQLDGHLEVGVVR